MPPKKDDTLLDLVDQVKKLSSLITSLEAKQAEISSKLDEHLLNNDRLASRVSFIELRQNELEQHSRAHCCRLFGLSVPDDNDPFITSEAVYAALLPILKLSVEDNFLKSVPSLLDTIDMSHKLPPTKENENTPPILVRFRSKLIRLAVLKTKGKYFKQSSNKFSIVEDLTKMNSALYKKTKDRQDVLSAWIRNGKIFYKLKKDPTKSLVAKPQ